MVRLPCVLLYRLMDEKKQNADEMRESIEGVRERYKYNSLATQLSRQQTRDNIFEGHYVGTEEASMVMENPLDGVLRYFSNWGHSTARVDGEARV